MRLLPIDYSMFFNSFLMKLRNSLGKMIYASVHVDKVDLPDVLYNCYVVFYD